MNQKRTVQEKNTSTESGDDRIFLIRPSKGWRFLNLKELWEFRELIYFLTWRDIKVRYKQTVNRGCLVHTEAGDDHGGLHHHF